MVVFSSVNEINRLISEGMSNIYLKVTVEKIDFHITLIF